MSCFVMDYKKTAQLADFLAALNDLGFNYFGFDCDYDLSRALVKCRSDGQTDTSKVFEMLVRYNYLAYDGRYKENGVNTPIPDMPPVQTLYRSKNENYIEERKRWQVVIEPWHYQSYKMLECYLYQICEDATKNSALYKALDQQLNIFGSFIVHNQTGYIMADWG